MNNTNKDKENNPYHPFPPPDVVGRFIAKIIVRTPLYILFYYLIVRPVFLYWWWVYHGIAPH